MSQITVLVVEDESIVSKDIQNSLKKLGYEVVGAASNGIKAIELAEEYRPDIILMDIMLKGNMSGIDTADRIFNQFNIPVIFITAYADTTTLMKAKITEPYGYIVKPFKEIDLHSNIEMAIYKHKQQQKVMKETNFLAAIIESKENNSPESIFIKTNNKLEKIDKKNIYYIEALKDYVTIFLSDRRYTIHSTMKDIHIKLGTDDFIRVHRSYIVRLDKIKTIDFPNIFLEDNKKMVPIGNSYKDDLNKRISLI